jgi:prephenate dehydratase
VQLVLDLLLHSELCIVDELVLPVEFACVANCGTREQITRVYAQFATQGQCLEFLDSIHGADVVTTASNGESLDMALKGAPGVAALVPRHAVAAGRFGLVIDNVGDFGNNQTRFVALGPQEVAYEKGTAFKTSLVVVEGMDRPGMLAEILGAFARRSVNLVSIMSRPTKESLGSYHFFIDIEGHGAEPRIEEALADVQKHNFVRSLGSYPRAVSL